MAFEDAVSASLELKKQLVDAGRLDVPQDELEQMLFDLVRKQGYGPKVVHRYRMVMRFHQQRVPLIVLLCGTGCIGKSILATRLAERLNLPSVLPTDLVYELTVPLSKFVPTIAACLHSLIPVTCSELNPQPLWDRPYISDEDTVRDFRKEAAVIRKGT